MGITGGSVQLLVNSEQHSHSVVLEEMLQKAEHFVCLVAFAKRSASLLETLNAALAAGLTARIAVGLSFHLTEPGVLRGLLDLRKKHPAQLKFYLSATQWTFHPKIYAVRGTQMCRVVVGSANLTAGGLDENYEASVVIDDGAGALMKSIEAHFDELLEQEALAEATLPWINAYEREFAVHDNWRRIARERADAITSRGARDFGALAYLLERMREDTTERGFTAQQRLRKTNQEQAKRKLLELASGTSIQVHDFPRHYEELLKLFHSGGLHRGKTVIAANASQFLSAISDVVARADLSAEAAFDLLRRHFEQIPRAGVNVLTEILHALDSDRFAVMNQNSVSGMSMAGFTGYPLRPLKAQLTGASYARFCADARLVQMELGLGSLTELDSLFNYAYWQ